MYHDVMTSYLNYSSLNVQSRMDMTDTEKKKEIGRAATRSTGERGNGGRSLGIVRSEFHGG